MYFTVVIFFTKCMKSEINNMKQLKALLILVGLLTFVEIKAIFDSDDDNSGNNVSLFVSVPRDTLHGDGDIDSDFDLRNALRNRLQSHFDNALFLAVIDNDLQGVKERLEEGYDPNKNVDNMGDSPLIYAVLLEQVEIVQALLDKGANPNQVTSSGSAPLIIAIKSDNLGVVKALLKAFANLNQQDNIGDTPYNAAIEGGNDEIIKVVNNQWDKDISLWLCVKYGDKCIGKCF